MFFISSVSPSGAFSDSYIVLDTQDKDEAVSTFHKVFSPFLTGRADAVLEISLFSCQKSDDPGEEILLRQALTTTISVPWKHTDWSYTHPLDKIVKHDRLPDGLLEALRPRLQ